MPETVWVPVAEVAALFSLPCFSPRCQQPASEGADCEMKPSGSIWPADTWHHPCAVMRLAHAAKSRIAWQADGSRRLEFAKDEVWKIAAALGRPVPDGFPLTSNPVEPAQVELLVPSTLSLPPPHEFLPVGVEVGVPLASGGESVVDTAIQRHQAAPQKSLATFADPDWRTFR